MGLPLLLASTIAIPAIAFTPVVGSEQRLSTDGAGSQGKPTIAGYPDGSYVVAWDQLARRFDSNGKPQGADFPLGAQGASQSPTALAPRADGGFVAVWSDGANAELKGRVFGADDLALSPEFDISNLTQGLQHLPSVAIGNDGRFLVAWSSEAPLGGDIDTGVHARLFDALGNPLGTEFLVNVYTTDYQTFPKVTATASGDFVIVWADRVQDGTFLSVFGRLYDEDAAPLTGEFPVNDVTDGLQVPGAVAATAAGGFIVVWEGDIPEVDSDLPPFDTAIFARVFDSGAAPVGTEFQVNTFSAGYQQQPHVSVRSDEVFLITWSSWNYVNSASAVHGQLFDASAQPTGDEFRIDSFAPVYKASPAGFLADPGDTFHVVWNVDGPHEPDGDGSGVFGAAGCIGAGLDSDADGIGDSCDLCDHPPGESFGTGTTVRFRFINDLNALGRFSWRGEFPVSAASFASYDPTSTPMHVRVTADRGAFIDVQLQAALSTGGASAGWQVNGAGTKWKYRDGSAEPADGIVRVLLQQISADSVRLKVVGKKHPYGMSPAETTLRATVSMGDARAGECGQTMFEAADCSFHGLARSFACRR